MSFYFAVKKNSIAKQICNSKTNIKYATILLSICYTEKGTRKERHVKQRENETFYASNFLKYVLYFLLLLEMNLTKQSHAQTWMPFTRT